MNRSLVLRTLRQAGKASQTGLVEETRLSAATMVSIIRELKALGLVHEVGVVESRVGRKPVHLEINPQGRFAQAIALSPDECRLALVDLNGSLAARADWPLDPTAGAGAWVEDVQRQASLMFDRQGISRTRLAGIGVSTPGIVDASRGVLVRSTHLGWQDVPLQRMLGEALGSRVFLEAEARVTARAEQEWGAALACDNFLLIEIGAGLGMVAVSEGRPLRGASNMAGELGAACVGPPSPAGGRPVSLEAVSSGWAMVKKWIETPGTGSGASVGPPSLRLAIRRLFAAARDGDRVANAIIDDAMTPLAAQIANLIHLFDPAKIVLAGSAIAESRGLIQSRLDAQTRSLLQAGRGGGIEMAETVLGEEASLLGASALVYDYQFAPEAELGPA